MASFRPAILIPCYRAKGLVGRVVRGALEHAVDVLVVDDGSGDGSAEEAEAAGVRVVRREKNGGKGAALRDGLELLLADPGITHVVFMDADGQHAASDLPQLLAAARRGEPFVIGARLQDRELVPAHRFWANYIGARVLSRMTGQTIEDSQSGYRVLDAELLRTLLPRLRSDGYAVESEILIKAAALGVPFSHVTVSTIYEDQPSHYRPFRDTWVTSWLSVWYKVFETD